MKNIIDKINSKEKILDFFGLPESKDKALAFLKVKENIIAIVGVILSLIASSAIDRITLLFAMFNKSGSGFFSFLSYIALATAAVFFAILLDRRNPKVRLVFMALNILAVVFMLLSGPFVDPLIVAMVCLAGTTACMYFIKMPLSGQVATEAPEQAPTQEQAPAESLSEEKVSGADLSGEETLAAVNVPADAEK